MIFLRRRKKECRITPFCGHTAFPPPVFGDEVALYPGFSAFWKSGWRCSFFYFFFLSLLSCERRTEGILFFLTFHLCVICPFFWSAQGRFFFLFFFSPERTAVTPPSSSSVGGMREAFPALHLPSLRVRGQGLSSFPRLSSFGLLVFWQTKLTPLPLSLPPPPLLPEDKPPQYFSRRRRRKAS